MNKLRGRALVVDDQIVWLELFSELLNELGLEVDTADTRERAIQLVGNRYYHLALIDVRLKDDELGNREGMDILAHIDQADLCDVITKVVITGYGTRDWARESFKKYRVHDFIPKQGPDGKGFDEDDLRASIQAAFVEQLAINLDLDMRFVHDFSLDEMVQKVAPQVEPGQQQRYLIWEMDDLLRKLFIDAKRITISRMTSGKSGAAVVQVEPFYEIRGQAEPIIVKYSAHIDEIKREERNYERYVTGFVAGGRHTDMKRYARTRSFGGIAYSLIGASVSRVRSLGQFYKTHNSEDICGVLDDLFGQTCKKWYENRQMPITSNLAELYWRDVERRSSQIHEAFEQWFGEYAGFEVIHFAEIGMALKNPVRHPFATSEPINLPVHSAMIHGDLNAENVFIDDDGHTWMIDFAKTGPGHILCDFVYLESVIKFQLMRSESLSLVSEFERAMVVPRDFGERVAFPRVPFSSDMTKAFTVVAHLRELAANVILPSRDVRTYYAAQFYHCLNLIRYPFMMQSKEHRDHILLSAALLCSRLEELMT